MEDQSISMENAQQQLIFQKMNEQNRQKQSVYFEDNFQPIKYEVAENSHQKDETPKIKKDQTENAHQSFSSSYIPESKESPDSDQKNRVKSRNNAKGRTTNNVSSNNIRSLINVIESIIKTQKPEAYDKITIFISDFEIKGQIWGFTGILISLVYLHDCREQINKQQLSTILKLIKTKIAKKRIKLSIQQIYDTPRKHYEYFMNHIEKFKQEIKNYKDIFQEVNYDSIEDFFKQVIQKRQKCVKDYMEEIQKIKMYLKQRSKGKPFLSNKDKISNSKIQQ